MIRTIVFDLGNVLLYFSHERMRRQVSDLCQCSLNDLEPLLNPYEGLFYEFERGQVSMTEFHRRFEDALRKPVGYSELMNAVSDIFTLNTSMRPVLSEIRARGTRLVILSNTNAAHIEFAKRQFDLFEEFDAEVLSYEVKSVKPETAIFEALFDTIQCEPSECFYTDDTPGHIQAGQGLGLQAEVFIDSTTLRDQLRQRNYELPTNPAK